MKISIQDPSGAAELVVPDRRDWIARLAVVRRRLAGALGRRLAESAQRHEWLSRRLMQCHPRVSLGHQAQRLDDFEQRLRYLLRDALAARMARAHTARLHLWRASPVAHLRELANRRLQLGLRLGSAMRRRLATATSRYGLAGRALNAVSPLATLERGYAIVSRHPDGALIRNSRQVRPGERIEARLMSGRLRAVIEETQGDREAQGPDAVRSGSPGEKGMMEQ